MVVENDPPWMRSPLCSRQWSHDCTSRSHRAAVVKTGSQALIVDVTKCAAVNWREEKTENTGRVRPSLTIVTITVQHGRMKARFKYGRLISLALQWVFIGLAVLSIALGLVFAWDGNYRLGTNAIPTHADFGQYLSGTTAPLWSLAAVFMVFAAYCSQRDDLSNQKSDEEVERTERTFFELIKLHHELVNGSTLRRNGGSYMHGRRCFTEAKRQLGIEFGKVAGIETYSTAKETYENFYDKHHNTTLGHYFRNLYHIVSYVDRSALDIKSKRRLIKFLRAQLSNPELELLFYNGVSMYGTESFFPLIVKYAFIEPLHDESMLLKNSLVYVSKNRVG